MDLWPFPEKKAFFLLFSPAIEKVWGEAVGEIPKGGRRKSDNGCEAAGEASKTIEAQGEANVCDPFGSIQQKFFGLFDPECRKILPRRDADGSPELPDEMPGGHPGIFGKFRNGGGF